jgi:hypothetical protein
LQRAEVEDPEAADHLAAAAMAVAVAVAVAVAAV